MALQDRTNKLHAFATQITHILPNIYYDVSPSIDSNQQYQDSLACAIGIPYVEGVGCEIWDLLMNHEGLSRTNKMQKVVPDYDKWRSTLGLTTAYVFNTIGRKGNRRTYLARGGAATSVPIFNTIPSRNKLKWCDSSDAWPYTIDISSYTTREGLTLLIPDVVGGQAGIKTPPLSKGSDLSDKGLKNSIRGGVRSSSRNATASKRPKYEERISKEKQVSSQKIKLSTGPTTTTTNNNTTTTNTNSFTPQNNSFTTPNTNNNNTYNTTATTNINNTNNITTATTTAPSSSSKNPTSTNATTSTETQTSISFEESLRFSSEATEEWDTRTYYIKTKMLISLLLCLSKDRSGNSQARIYI